MELLKNMGQALKFKERYDDMDRYGMEEYDKGDCKQLKELKESGAPLSESQEETLKYCETIRGERTRALTQAGLSTAKVVGGAITGNPQLIGQGVGDFGKYMAGEAQEVAGGNDPEGQELQKGELAKMGLTSAVTGATALAAGKAQTLGEGGGDTSNLLSTLGQMPSGTGIPNVGGDANAMMQQMMANPQMMQMMMQMMQQQGAQSAFQTGGAQGTLGYLANQNNRGSKLKRSTRQHSYIKGNTRGLV